MTGDPGSAIRSERSLLSMLAAAITSQLDLQGVLQAVTDIGTDVAGAEFGAFFYNELDETGAVYQLHVLSGAFLETFAAMPKPRITALFEPTFTGEATVRSDDVRTDPRFSGMPQGHLPVRSYLAVPVVTRTDEVIGALLFGHRDRARFDADTEQTLLTVAAQAAVAVENARLFAAEQAARQRAEDSSSRLALLQSLANRLSAAMTLEATVAAMAETMMEPIGAARVGIFLAEDDGYRHLSSGADHDGFAPQLSFLPDRLPNPVATLIADGQALRVMTGAELVAEYPELCSRVGRVPTVVVVLALTTGEHVLGGCTLSWDVERDVTDADLEMFTAAVANIGSTIHRARLFDAERAARADLANSIRAATETSRALQRALLPLKLPKLDGLEVAVRYQASDDDAEVGGDWYDVIPREHGAVLVIGDVQGHNLTAAALMGQLRTGLHAYLAEGHSLDNAVARANHLIFQLADGLLATCCLVEIDLLAREMRMVSAGHPGAIGVTGGTDLMIIPDDTGLPLGVLPDSQWSVVRAPLSSEDRIVLYTDGLIERRGSDIYAGIERLRAAIPPLAVANAESAARSIVDTLGSDAEDDLALLVCDVKRTGLPNQTRTFVLGAELNDVSVIRGHARRALTSWNLTALDYSAALVVSELTTNVLRHAHGYGVLQLQALPGGVRILASDDNDRLPLLDLEPDDAATHGRGLLMVKALADRWGVDVNPVGKTIWAEFHTGQDNLIPFSGREGRQAAS